MFSLPAFVRLIGGPDLVVELVFGRVRSVVVETKSSTSSQYPISSSTPLSALVSVLFAGDHRATGVDLYVLRRRLMCSLSLN